MITDIANLGIPTSGLPDLASKKVSETSNDPNAMSGSGPSAPKESFKAALDSKMPKSSKDGDAQQQNEPVRLARSVAKSEGKANSSGGLTERQRVMQEFMASMESELGIPPEEVVAAISKLSPRDMLRAPEETVTEVLHNLNLSEEDSERAAVLYLGMLTQLQELPREQMVSAVPTHSKSYMAENLFLTPQEKKQALNKSIDQMNDQFFMRDLGFKPLPTERIAPEASGDLNEKLLQQMQKPTSELAPKDEELLRRLMQAGSAAGAVAKVLEESPQVQETLEMEQKINSFKPEVSEIGASLETPVSMMGSQLGAESSMEQGFSGEASQGEVIEGLSQEISAKDASAAKFADLVQNPRAETSAVRAESVPAMAMMSPRGEVNGEQEANIAHIMNQAKYMIKKGGGEAKVTMSPEGLGQLQLRVMVNEGKVNIEMNAETNEAKKMLESSLGDLKSSLASQRLAVDSIKVDVGNRTGQESGFSNQPGDQQRQSDMSDSQRDQARNLFNMLRDEGMAGRRGGFYETPGYKAYKGKSQEIEPLQPADSAKVQSKRWAGTGRGSTVDLVA